MPKPPEVSVVIPTYNRREFAIEAVSSVLAQSFSSFEMIVVDDGSTDGTADCLRERFDDPRVLILVRERGGVSAARNRGAEAARAPWLAFLDSDDLWQPEKLTNQLAATLQNPDCPASYTEEIWYRNGKWANPRNVHAKHSGHIFSHCLPLCIISPSSILLRREVYRQLGGFDESLPACEDYDLWLRLSARHPVLLVPEKLIVKRNGHEGQLSRDHWGLDRFRVRALWKIAFDETLDAECRREALCWVATKAAVVAEGAAKRGEAERARIFEHSRKEAERWLTQFAG